MAYKSSFLLLDYSNMLYIINGFNHKPHSSRSTYNLINNLFPRIYHTYNILSYFLAIKIHENYKGFINYFISEEKFKKTNKIFDEKGNIFILISSITFIPYKVIAWLSGLMRYKVTTFSIYTLIGRFIRYGTVGILSYIFGNKIQNIIETSLQISDYIAYVLLGLVIIYFISWFLIKKININLK